MGNKQLFGIMPASQFGIGADINSTRLIKLDPSPQNDETTVTLQSGAGTTTDITLTLPNTSGTLGFSGDSINFSRRYWTVQHWISANTNGCNNWTNTAAGDAVNLFIRNGTTDMVGGVGMQTGTQSGGRVVTHTAVSPVQIGGGEIVYETTVILGALSTAGDRYTALVGFGDSVATAAQTDAVLLSYNDSVSANWVLVTNQAGVSTATDTGIPATTDLTRLKVVISADGTTAYGYVDGVLGATSTTNLPNSAGQLMGMLAGIFKSTGTTSVDFSVGPIYFEIDYS